LLSFIVVRKKKKNAGSAASKVAELGEPSADGLLQKCD
jgi:hypothetical protein